jgi:hypothetical protein
LRPLEPIEGIPEQTEVVLTVVSKAVMGPSWEAVCGILPKEDAEDMRRIIEAEFETVNMNEW